MFHQLKCLLNSPRELCLIYACEYADSFSTFALDYVFVLYLSMCFGMSDVAASWIYGLYGLMSLLFGVFFGPLIDNLGVKYSLLLGTATSFFARLTLVFATDISSMLATLLFLLPMGVSLTSNVLKLAIRRYTSASTHSFAFDGSYLMINSAALSSALLLTTTRSMTSDLGQPYRPYLLLAASPGLIQLLLCFFFRNSVSSLSTHSLRYSNKFYILLVSGVFSLSPRLYGQLNPCRHFGSSFPKTFTRSTNARVPFELVLGVNPLIVGFLLPFSSPALHAAGLSTYTLLIIGSFISALSMFILCFSSSLSGAVCGIMFFTIGEIIWAPRLIQMAVQVGDEGREGTVLALSAIPRYAARLLAGASSGYLLQTFCKDAGHCSNGGEVWKWIGVLALLTPTALIILKPQLQIPNDALEEMPTKVEGDMLNYQYQEEDEYL